LKQLSQKFLLCTLKHTFLQFRRFCMQRSDKETSCFGFTLRYLLVVALLGLLHNVRVLLLECDRFLLESDESLVNLLGNLAQVLDHGFELRDNLLLSLLEEDAVDQSPALAAVFKFAHLFKDQSTLTQNQVNVRFNMPSVN
jgi:hypothetical protein